MRKAAVVLASGLALLWAAPASAHQEHTSCKAFGQGTAAVAHELGGVGTFVQSVNTGPGAVAGQVAGFHQEFCA
jgi:hypothetical protein